MRLSHSPTGIKPILEGFRLNGNIIDQKKSKEIILERLIELGEIDNKKEWFVRFTPYHHWSDFNADGYAESIYGVDTDVYKFIK